MYNRYVYTPLPHIQSTVGNIAMPEPESSFPFPVRPTFSDSRGEGWASSRSLAPNEVVLRVAPLVAVPRTSYISCTCGGCFRQGAVGEEEKEEENVHPRPHGDHMGPHGDHGGQRERRAVGKKDSSTHALLGKPMAWYVLTHPHISSKSVILPIPRSCF